MNTRKMTWAFGAALVLAALPAVPGLPAVAGTASAEEGVKLEYNLKPGTELVYKASGTVKVAQGNFAATEATLSGLERFIVAETDAKTGAMLIGRMPELAVATKMNAGAGAKPVEQKLEAASVFRMDRAGNVAARKPKDEAAPAAPASTTGQSAQLMDRRDLEPPPLPGAEILVGGTWASVMDCNVPTLFQPVQAKAASTLAEIKVVDGHKCALIKTELTPADEKPGNARSPLAVTGEMEMLFDIEGGFVRSLSSKFEAARKINGVAALTYSVETTKTLDSAKALPADQAKVAATVIAGLDSAATSLSDGDQAKAIETLQKLKDGDLPEAWKSRVEKTLDQVNMRFGRRPQGMVNVGGAGMIINIGPANRVTLSSAGGQAAPAAPTADELFSAGQKAMNDENWADAVAKFKELAEKYPKDSRTTDALTVAAAVCENRLNDSKSADELRKKAAALKEKP